jgi:hypothetical protein
MWKCAGLAQRALADCGISREVAMRSPQHYRDQAATARRLAAQTLDLKLRAQLEAAARFYDERGDELERENTNKPLTE